MSKWPLLMCPECGSPLQHFALNIEQNVFMCIGERKRDKFRGVVHKETYSELKECSYPFSQTAIDLAFFTCAYSDTFKKAHEIADFLSERRNSKYAPSQSVLDPLPPLILQKSYSYMYQALQMSQNVSEAEEVSTEDFCLHN